MESGFFEKNAINTKRVKRISKEDKIKRIFSLKGCEPCEIVKTHFKNEIMTGKVILEEIGDINDKKELTKAISMVERGINAFPTLETENGRYCRVKTINEDNIELECINNEAKKE